MKSTIFTFLLFIASGVFAQTGNVVFFTEDGELFTLSQNGIKVNAQPMSNVRIDGMQGNYFMASITFADAALGVVKKNAMCTAGHELTYKIKKNKQGEWKLSPFSDVVIAVNPVAIRAIEDDLSQTAVTDPGAYQNQTSPSNEDHTMVAAPNDISNTNSTSTAVVSKNSDVSMNVSVNGTQGGVQATTTNQSNKATINTGVSTGTNNADKGQGMGLSVNINVSGLQSMNGTAATTNSVADDNSSDDVSLSEGKGNTGAPARDGLTKNSNSGAQGCAMAMDADDFSSATTSISTKSFEDSKLKVAQQLTEANCLSTSQVKAIMAMFSHESTKLEYAKYAYAYTFDKKNYYKINDAFTFESSIEELQAFVKANK